MTPKAFDRSELQQCYGCGRGVLQNGDIHFYEVTVNQCIADLSSIRQQAGLEMMTGSTAIAAALSPGTRVAHRLEGKRRLLCGKCALGEHNVAIMLEDE